MKNKKKNKKRDFQHQHKFIHSFSESFVGVLLFDLDGETAKNKRHEIIITVRIIIARHWIYDNRRI